jgi:hypothetical protein
MNKNDIKLLIVVLIFIILLFIFLHKPNNKALLANIYYKNDLLMSVSLSTNNIYSVNGDNGPVLIEVNDNKIRVIEENSNYHYCSKQGYISNVGESIICLPNKIIIELPSDEVDVEVK